MILTAVDRSERAADIVGEAAALAEAFDDEIHVVHVLGRSEFVELERTSVDETGTGRSIESVKMVAREIAQEAVDDADIEATAVGLMGDPKEAIVQYAADNDARYVVVGTRKRSPAGKALFGSVAQSVLLNSACPVLTVTDRND